MKNRRNNPITNFLLMLFSLIFIILVFEVAFECYRFQKEHYEYSALLMEIRQRFDFMGKDEADESNFYENPFIAYAINDKQAQYKLHPFIGFSGVHGPAGKIIGWDHFGFRNNENLYFEDKDYELVVITGGSEAAGYSHNKAIAQNLEEELNKRSGRKFKVLNLAMNSYTLSNEINAYVHLAYHLKPEFVISHTGYNDMLYSLMVPRGFRTLGLNYFKNMELWLPRLYDLKNSEDVKFPLDKAYPNMTMEGFSRNLKKYKTIVEGNGGRFIVGIQGHDIKAAPPDKNRLLHELAVDRMLTLNYFLRQETGLGYRYIDFGKINNLDYVDIVHSTEESSSKIAKIYADLILNVSQVDKQEASRHTAGSQQP